MVGLVNVMWKIFNKMLNGCVFVSTALWRTLTKTEVEIKVALHCSSAPDFYPIASQIGWKHNWAADWAKAGLDAPPDWPPPTSVLRAPYLYLSPNTTTKTKTNTNTNTNTLQIKNTACSHDWPHWDFNQH